MEIQKPNSIIQTIQNQPKSCGYVKHAIKPNTYKKTSQKNFNHDSITGKNHRGGGGRIPMASFASVHADTGAPPRFQAGPYQRARSPPVLSPSPPRTDPFARYIRSPSTIAFVGFLAFCVAQVIVVNGFVMVRPVTSLSLHRQRRHAGQTDRTPRQKERQYGA